jgi:hypothetical protein
MFRWREAADDHRRRGHWARVRSEIVRVQNRQSRRSVVKVDAGVLRSRRDFAQTLGGEML